MPDEPRSPEVRAADHAAIERLADDLVPALIAKLSASGLGDGISFREPGRLWAMSLTLLPLATFWFASPIIAYMLSRPITRLPTAFSPASRAPAER